MELRIKIPPLLMVLLMKRRLGRDFSPKWLRDEYDRQPGRNGGHLQVEPSENGVLGFNWLGNFFHFCESTFTSARWFPEENAQRFSQTVNIRQDFWCQFSLMKWKERENSWNDLTGHYWTLQVRYFLRIHLKNILINHWQQKQEC